MRDVEPWLAVAVVELADTLVPGFKPETYWRCLAQRFAELITQSSCWVIVLDDDAVAHVVAGSDDRISGLALLDQRTGHGPGMDCLRAGVRCANVDVAGAADRWPAFAPMATSLGFRMAHAFPLRRLATVLGSVAVISAESRPVTPEEAGVARTLAYVATLGILQHRTITGLRRTSLQLNRALDSRVVIEQAKGVLVARLGVEIGVAFEVLRDYARAHNRRLDEVADSVVRGRLPVTELRTPEHARNPRARARSARTALRVTDRSSNR